MPKSSKSHVKKIIKDKQNIDLVNNVVNEIEKMIATTVQHLNAETKKLAKDNKLELTDRAKLLPLKYNVAAMASSYFQDIGLPIGLEYNEATKAFNIVALTTEQLPQLSKPVISDDELQATITTLMKNNPNPENALQQSAKQLEFWLKNLDQDINKLADNELKKSTFREQFKKGLCKAIDVVMTIIPVVLNMVVMIFGVKIPNITPFIAMAKEPIKNFCMSENKVINACANGIFNKFLAYDEKKQDINNTKDNMAYLVTFTQGLQEISQSVNKDLGAQMQKG